MRWWARWSSSPRIELDRPTLLDVLQHRGLMRTDALGAGDAPLERDSKGDAELVRHRFSLAHHVGRKLARERKLTNIHQRCMGERADRIEGHVAPELEPDLAANVGGDGGLEARSSQRFCKHLHATGFGAIRLAERESIALDDLNHSGGDQIRGGEDHAADDAR